MSGPSIVIAEWPMHPTEGYAFTLDECGEKIENAVSDKLANGEELDADEVEAALAQLLWEKNPDIFRHATSCGDELVLAVYGSHGFRALDWLVNNDLLVGRTL